MLAAVDSHVTCHVFGESLCRIHRSSIPSDSCDVSSSTDHVIGPQGLLAMKARVIVTDSIHFLKQFDHIVYICRGIILEQGAYSELINNLESEFYKLL